jgi:hypothetical protein
MERPAKTVSMDVSDNWDEHPEVLRAVSWALAPDPIRPILFQAAVEGQQWSVRLNDFPDEPAFTLLLDGGEVLHFDDWPKAWGAMPALPRRTSP